MRPSVHVTPFDTSWETREVPLLLQQLEPPKGSKVVGSMKESPAKPLTYCKNVVRILKPVDRRQMANDLATVTQSKPIRTQPGEFIITVPILLRLEYRPIRSQNRSREYIPCENGA